MTNAVLTLWDLLKPAKKPARGRRKDATEPSPPRVVTPQPAGASPNGQSKRRRPASKVSMQERYAALVVEMKQAYGLRVRKWRSNSSGCAWEVHYADGTVSRLIESPQPRGPMSCAIFLHEVGHHAIGLARYKPRCLEEYHAWQWALKTMRERGFNVTPSVEKRMAESLRHAVAKARRRGLKRLPVELVPYASRNGEA